MYVRALNWDSLNQKENAKWKKLALFKYSSLIERLEQTGNWLRPASGRADAVVASALAVVSLEEEEEEEEEGSGNLLVI